jgi:mannosyltransferase OCH1-like enzyme
MIPKKIHQIFFQINKPLDEFPIFLESIASIKKIVPEYKYKLWQYDDVKILIHSYFPKQYIFWRDNLSPIQQIDFARWVILYVHGGIYMDLDIILLRPLDDLLDNEYLFVEESKKMKFKNSLMGTEEGQLIWTKLIENCESNFIEKKNIEVYKTWKVRFVLQTTGPAYLGKQLKKWLPEYVPLKNIMYDRNSKGEQGDRNYYMIDHFLGTWVPEKTENNWVKNSPQTQKFIKKYTNKING